MRRQARISTGGALVVRSASALQVWLWLLIFIFQNEFVQIFGSIKPGYLDFDNLPETNFTCDGKVIGGYYADLETSCQMFHVCTVGQQDEPMDIKFLCLNGTVFDQETRVCERVDEVDCTKSEKFYSLNLELYGSTVPPIIQADQEKPEAESTEQSKQTKVPQEQEIDPAIDDASTTTHVSSKTHNQSLDITDSTEDPVLEIKKDEPKITHINRPTYQPIQVSEHEELTEEYQDDDDTVYEDYSHLPTTTTAAPITTTVRTTTRSIPRPTTTITTTTSKPPTTTIFSSPSTSFRSSPATHLFSSPSPTLSSLSPPSYSSISSTLDPSLLSPQEFIYRHRGPGSEAISFQRHSFRPADGVYITHAPPQQFDHFQYESSRTAPRPAVARPSSFVQRPQPAPFRPTTLDPRDQLLRPGPTFQSSERHETSIKHKQPYPSSLPAQRPLPFNTFYYDRKRSEDSIPEDESSLSPRSVAPPTVTERPPTKPKSPPRVIVTASASVSDSNGKRLNYTVGNVVNAVKPIVQINYDDYKESDLLFDPFFLDVPKLQKRRKNRSYGKTFAVPDTATISSELAAEKTTATMSPVTSRATTTERPTTTPFTTTTTVAWNPNDYVDDNYEPHAYIPPIPPLAILVPQDRNKFRNQNRKSVNDLIDERRRQDESKAGQLEQSKPTSAAQTTSSQNAGASAASLATATSLSPPPPLEAPACATSRSSDCRTRA
ncbi:uncharacterized protein ACR2FA_003472 [Aphomia sociella]